jgi:O-antigen/teichoic acid export membrane protein
MHRQFFYFGAVFFGAGGQFLANYFMSQNLDLQTFGFFSLVLSIVGAASSLVLFGQATAMSVVIFSDEKSGNRYFSREIRTSLGLIAVLFCACSIIAAILWFYFYKNDFDLSFVTLLIAGSLAMALQLFFMSLIQCLDHYKGYFTVSVLGATILISFAWFASTPNDYIFGIIVSAASVGVLVVSFLAKEFFNDNKNDYGKEFGGKELVVLGCVAVPGMLITYATAFADKYLLNKFLSLEAVGLYSLGFLISVGVGRVLVSGILRANSVYFMQNLQRSEFKQAAILLQRSEALLCLFCILALVGYYTVGLPLITFIVGERYVPAYPIMLGLFIAVMVEGMVFFFGQVIIQKKKLYLLVVNNSILLVISVGFNYALIPIFNLNGPVLVIFGTQLILLLIVFYQVKKIASWISFPWYLVSTATCIFTLNQLI